MNDRGLVFLLAAIVTLGSIATNMYIPALPAVRAYFDAGVAAVQATFAVALVTFAIGILVWGPVSDRFGRRPTILAGIAVVVVGASELYEGVLHVSGYIPVPQPFGIRAIAGVDADRSI